MEGPQLFLFGFWWFLDKGEVTLGCIFYIWGVYVLLPLQPDTSGIAASLRAELAQLEAQLQAARRAANEAEAAQRAAVREVRPIPDIKPLARAVLKDSILICEMRQRSK